MIGSQSAIFELQRVARRRIEAAKRLEAEGKLSEAAEQLRSAAGTIRQMAEQEVVQQDRVRRYHKAKEAEDMAARLDSGKRVFGQEKEASKESVAAEDEYRASVDELVYRSPITWDEIGGMDTVKASLKYTFGLMLAKMPEGANLDIASRILFYGPPGTGKTLMAAACSNMIGATFFNVKASDLLSKYFGESTKLISALYNRARSEADTGAAVIFIDEFDALSQERGGAGETGAERRILSTLLAELDGLADKGGPSRVITIVATNRPWNMDEAILQRFERHILVDLPDTEAREEIFKIHIEGKGLRLAGTNYADLARCADGFSGRLIQRVCKHAVESMVREMNNSVPGKVDTSTIREYEIAIRPLSTKDFETAFSRVKAPSRDQSLAKYREWAEKIGGERA